MRRIALFAALAATLTAPFFATVTHAQTNIASNLGGNTTGNLGVLASEGNALAQQFVTSAATLSLNSATVRLGGGKGANADTGLSLYTDASGVPGTEIAAIGSRVTIPSVTPEATDFTFTADSPIALLADTTYWIVLDSNGDGGTTWSATDGAVTSDFAVVFGDTAQIGGVFASWSPSNAGAGNTALLSLQARVTVVPEAGSLALLVPALGVFGAVVRRRTA